ncbi:protein tolB [Candidatus Photodesmus katoptron]|uniref:Tol-Pal system beta propeller repeat protein TolB n=1 Tax=Candidatus Photodesmus anomalopis TaxID=28176 RepID=UPI0004D3429A|nr:Tol-Pal system beta propeller repeat protein TolB [Candidatus Photodesmus katoptron]KEY90716.1 protein tolB [Candidatus Photodesmus katoptron]
MKLFLLKILGCFFLLLLIPIESTNSALELIITDGINKARPVAILPLNWTGSSKLPQDVSSIITADLQNSGKFNPIPIPKILKIPDFESDMDFDIWVNLGVEVVFLGSILENQDGNYIIKYQLVDIARAKFNKEKKDILGFDIRSIFNKNHLLLSTRAIVPANQLRKYAHRISDLIYESLTGEKGAFVTKIAYIVVENEGLYPYQLRIADYDGHNERLLLSSKQPLMSPAWSPNAKKIAYVSFQNGKSGIFIIDIYTGEHYQVTAYPRHNGAPKFSPDGTKLALVLSKTGRLQIYTLDLKLNELTQITRGSSNNTEPFWHPNGNSLIFTSDRGGKPQIYQVNLTNDKINRLTWRGIKNLSGQITSDGKFLVMVSQIGNSGFNLAKQDLESGVVQILTNTFLDESPSISPNGNMIIYSSIYNESNALSIVSMDGRFTARLPKRKQRVKSPAWSPFSHNN